MKWQLAAAAPQDFIDKHPEIDPVVLALLWNRGVKGDIGKFLDPDYEKDSHDPFLFRQMQAAADKVIEHIKDQNLITVYGDYDADGVTSSALMIEMLALLKARVDIYIPHRFKEGYGLNREAIDRIASSGSKLIITVDGGIRSVDEVKYAQELGLEIVLTDHHTTARQEDGSDDLPDCLIINPAVQAETYPFKTLAGVGVAFKLAQAIIFKSKLSGKDKAKLERKLLDLVAIGTVADCVSLAGENRVLVREGLRILNNTKRKGLKALMEVAKIDSGRINAWNIGFQIAPRLNAAGRLGSATIPFELLTTADKKEALRMANELNLQNQERQQITENILAQAEEQIKESLNKKILVAVCQLDESQEEGVWNEGVVGLVAGRLCNKYYRPALVITKTKEGFKGSGRSIPEMDLVKAIARAGEYLEKSGGHPAAAGFSLRNDQVDSFKRKMEEIAHELLADIDLSPTVAVECKLELRDLNEALVDDLLKFEPFGADNPQPVFLSEGLEVMDIITMGLSGQHLKLRVKSEGSPVLSALAFNRADKWDLKLGSLIDMVYTVEYNDFNGKREMQMKIVDLELRSEKLEVRSKKINDK